MSSSLRTHDQLWVWIPDPQARLDAAPASAIVSRAPQGETLVCHLEGNLYGASNMVTWADRLFHAAGRAIAGYPTSAVRAYRRADLLPVARWDHDRGEALIDPVRAGELAAWLGCPVTELDNEASTTCSLRHEAQRALEHLEQTPQGRMHAAWLRAHGPAPYRQ